MIEDDGALQVKSAKLYRVKKIYDLREDRPIKPGSYEESRMSGQAARAYVPTEEYIRMQKIADVARKEFDRWASEADWKDLWVLQLTLDPIIGQPIYFSSVKMDAGYYRTSLVKKVLKVNDTTTHITTCGSILEVVEAD